MNKKDIALNWGLIGVVISFTISIAYCLGFTLSGTEETILNTLAVVQGAIFAIAFSVIILGVRLSANRYSPRLASTFRSDFSYKWTVGVFGISIGSAITVLYLINTLPEFSLTAAVMIVTGLTGGAFWTLYQFVNETLEKTTPEGILTQVEAGLTPDSIIRDAVKSSKTSTNPDPFLVLISIIRSVIEEKDRISATIGLNILSSKISELLESADECHFEEGGPVDESLENVIVEQLPDIAEEAIDNDLTQTAFEVTDASEKIGNAAIDQETDQVLEYVLRGQSHLVAYLRYDQPNERVRYEAIDSSSDLLKKSADRQLWKGTAVGTRLLGWLASRSITNRSEIGSNRGYTSLLILCFPKLLSKTIDSSEDIDDYRASQWLRAHRLDEIQPSELTIASCYSSMTELTSAAIRFELRFEQPIVQWESVSAGWAEGMESLSNSDLQSMRELWFGTILYIEYLSDVTPSEVMDERTNRAVFDADNKFAQQTVDKILDGRLQPKKLMDMIPGAVDPVEMPLTGNMSAIVSDPHISFNNWLERERHIFRIEQFAEPVSEEDSEED